MNDTNHNSQQMYGIDYYTKSFDPPMVRSKVWMDFFEHVAHQIYTKITPVTVLDVGCSIGLLVEHLRRRGTEAEGIDISEYAISQVDDPIKPYCRVGSALDKIEKRYDLIVTIEVFEHLLPEQTEAAIANICSATNDILFSSTPNDIKEPTHFNVGTQGAWAEQFSKHGFMLTDFDASFISAWAMRFTKST